MMEPRWWRLEGPGAARCGMCVHGCLISDGNSGMCGARFFSSSDGFSSPYLGRFISAAIDPIEKKPLYHWRPGTKIMSLGGAGCNMTCPFCQNYTISHPIRRPAPDELHGISPEFLAALTKENGLSSVAYTYNEPTLQGEYIIAAARVLNDSGIASAIVTNGIFSAELCADISPVISAANIDVKTFDAETYRRIGGDLRTVMSNVESLLRGGVHVELTNLVVPGISDSIDDFARMVDWIAGMDRHIPLHISRYFPSFRYSTPPTDVRVMGKFRSHAVTKLSRVHLGNVW